MRLIDAEALKKALKSNCKPELCGDYGKDYCKHCCPHNDFEDLIDNAPTVDLWQLRQETTENALKKAEVLYKRPEGEWYYNYQNGWHCSICNNSVKDMPTVMGKANFAFCPNCGADMR